MVEVSKSGISISYRIARLPILLLVMLTLLLPQMAHAAVVYVSKDATGTNNGSSWANAFTTLQPAMNAAVAGDEVWIAAGNYGENRTPLGRLVVPTNITVVGGFAGGETSIEQRNTTVNRSVIDGSTSDAGGRAEQVIQDAANCNFIGIVFKGGNAASADSGALNVESDMEFLECSFEDNSAQNLGGAVFCATSGVNVSFRKCVFRNNEAGTRGGAVFYSPPSPASPILFEDCIFDGNRHLNRNQPYPNGGGGGAVYLENNKPGIFRRCVFSSNIADGFDGAVSIENSATIFESCLFYGNQAGLQGAVTTLNSGATKYVNCTFANNTATTGGAIYAVDTPATLSNCILWGGSSPQITVQSGSAPLVSYSDVAGGFVGTGNINADPLFKNAAGSDFRLMAVSPCVDSGNGAGAPPTDLAKKTRPLGAGFDMGAYEFDASTAWRLETAEAGFGERFRHASAVFDDKLWVITGHKSSDPFSGGNNETYSSADGISWTERSPVAEREGGVAAAFAGKLWLFGGATGSSTTFSTANGNTWHNEGTTIQTWGGVALEFSNKLYSIGGFSSVHTNQVLSSSDGITWNTLPNAPWQARTQLSGVVFHNRIWIMGGETDAGRTNDVWSTTDGTNWTQEVISAPWERRAAAACIVAADKIWLMGGYDSTDSGRNDIWTSDDGRNWTLFDVAADWTPRLDFTALTLNNRIYVIAGRAAANTYQPMTDVWSLAIDTSLRSTDFSYTNDSIDRLTQVDSNVGTRVHYDYDPAGNRLGKEVSAVLDIEAGAATPSSSGVPSGTADVEVLQIALKASAGLEGANLIGVTFTPSGTGNEGTGIALAKLWVDLNNDGNLDGGDTLLNSVSPPADNAPLVFSGLALPIPSGTTKHLLLTYDVAGAALPGETFTASIASRQAIIATGSTSGKPLYVMGAPVAGATLTISTDATPPTFGGIESAEPGDGQVTIGWSLATDAVDAQGSLSYAVWVSETSPAGNGAPNYITPGVSALDEYGVNLDPTKLFFTIQGLTNGQTYFLLVRAQDTKGNRSNNSNELPATPLAPLYTLSVGGVNGSVGISPQGGIYEAGSIVTLSPVADEGYVFSGWTGDVGPTETETTPLSVLLDQPKSITANFSTGSGTVEVAVSPEDAPWVVTDATSGTHQGVGNTTLTNLPVGSTIIAWGNVPGQLAPQPATENSYLPASGVLRFVGAYTAINTGVNCLTCTPDTKTHYNVGQTACLGVTGIFPPNTLFQWSKQGAGVLTEGRMTGVNCQTLSIPGLVEDDSGVYVCEYEGQKSLYSIEITVGSNGVPISTIAGLVLLAGTVSLLGMVALRNGHAKTTKEQG